jgi:hypothetical protein
VNTKPSDDLMARFGAQKAAAAVSLADAKKAAAALMEHENELRTRHFERTEESRRVHAALRPMEEVLLNASRLVDAAAAEWTKDWGALCTRELSGYIHIETDSFGNLKERTRNPRLPHIEAAKLDFGMLCALAPDVIKAKLHGVIQAQKPETFGLSAADRAARLVALKAEIAETERMHAELMDGAAAVGITLSPLVRQE